MPFVAIVKRTGERLDITQIDHPKQRYSYGDCLCQLCNAPLRIKGGLHVRFHFAHDPNVLCATDYSSQPESAHHRAAKLFLVERLRKEFPEYQHAQIECEVPIPQVKRVADILVTFPNGWKQAHEIQLASITTNELEARTNDYERAGIDVVWWLGQSADTPGNREWCIHTFGNNFSLSFNA